MYLNRNQTTLLILAAAVSHSVSNPAGTNQEKSRTANIHLGSNTVLLTKLASCTDAPPFAEEPFPIAYANVQPDSNWTNYKLSDSWYSNHYLSGPHYLSASHSSTPYADFKCQYTCNANQDCRAYFGYYEDVDTPNEHHQCVLFDAIIKAEDLVLSSAAGILPSGAFDRICHSGQNDTTYLAKRATT